MSEVVSRPRTLDPRLFADSTQQSVFRQLMTATSFPGRIQILPFGLDALQATLVCLVDAQTTFADPCQLLSPLMVSQLECKTVPTDEAMTVVAAGTVDPLDCVSRPRRGTLESPDASALIVLQVAALDQSATDTSVVLSLQGPGIQSRIHLGVEGLDTAWVAQRAMWNSEFPMGVDFILTCGDRLAALPRTTQILGVN